MPHCHVMQEESDCRTQSGTGSSSVQSGTCSFGLRLAGSAPWTRADSWRRRAWRRRRFLAKAERFPRACHLGCACSSMKTANQRSRCGGGVCRLAGGLTSGFGRRASGVGGSRLKMSARSRAGDLEGIERSCGRRRCPAIRIVDMTAWPAMVPRGQLLQELMAGGKEDVVQSEHVCASYAIYNYK